MTFYKGTAYGQDSRFINKDKKLIDALEFPEEYKDSVSIRKINLDIIKSWIERKLNDILGFEDECISGYIINQLQETEEFINPKKLQYSLTGFLENNSFDFMKEFWKILLSAQKAPDGIPVELIEDKKKEIINKTQKKKEKLKFLDDLLGNSNTNNKEEHEAKNTNNNLALSKQNRFDNSRSINNDAKRKKSLSSSSSLSSAFEDKRAKDDKETQSHHHHSSHRNHYHHKKHHNHYDRHRNNHKYKRDKSRSIKRNRSKRSN